MAQCVKTGCVVSEVLEKGPQLVAKRFAWRDRKGEFHLLENMETRHLFHVVRMIWDHSMPLEFRTNYPKRYTFPEFYTTDYMALAVKMGLPELLARKDLEEYMAFWLDWMVNCLRSQKRKIDFVKKIESL